MKEKNEKKKMEEKNKKESEYQWHLKNDVGNFR